MLAKIMVSVCVKEVSQRSLGESLRQSPETIAYPSMTLYCLAGQLGPPSALSDVSSSQRHSLSSTECKLTWEYNSVI